MIKIDIPYEYMNGHLYANQQGMLDWSKEKFERFLQLRNMINLTEEERDELYELKDEFYDYSKISIIGYEIEDVGSLMFDEGVIQYFED